MRDRPFVWCVCWLVAGTALVTITPSETSYALLACAAACACVALPFAPVRWLTAACGMCGAGLLVASLATLRDAIPDDLALLAGTDGSRPVEVVGMVESNARWDADAARLRVGLRVERVRIDGAWKPWSGRALWSWYEPAGAPQPGERVQVAGRLRAARGWRNFGLFDYGAYLRHNGFHTLLYSGSNATVISLGRTRLPWPRGAIASAREGAARCVARVPASDDARGLLLAVLTGDRRWLSAHVREATQATGTYHLLSISGLHVGIVAGWLLAAIRALSLRPTVGTIVLLLGLSAYVLLTGAAVPVVRAGIMVGVATVLLRLSRPPDSASILALAAAVIVVMDPLAFHEAGTQLSFVATAALVLGFPAAAAWSVRAIRARVPRRFHTVAIWTAYAAIAPALVQVAIAPLLVYHFHQLPLLSVVANVVATPMLFVVLATGAIAVLGLAVHPVVGAVPSALAGWCASALVKWVDALAALQFGPPVWAGPNIPLMVAATLGALLVWKLARRRVAVRFASVGVWLGVLALGPLPHLRHDLEVHVLDVGHGSATILRFADGTVMVIDGGRRSRTFDVGEMIVEPYLLRRGIRRIDYLVATHPQNDHIGGLIRLVERFPVAEIWTNGDNLDTWTATRFREVCAASGATVRTLRRGEQVAIGGAVVRVLHPEPDLARESPNATNNNSLVLRMDYGGVALLLPGDVSQSLAGAVQAGAPWPDRVIVQAPHHGHPRSGTGAIVAALRPTIAWASLAPVWPARAQLEGVRGAKSVWRTDLQGGLQLRISRDGAMTLRSADGATASWPPVSEHAATRQLAATPKPLL